MKNRRLQIVRNAATAVAIVMVVLFASTNCQAQAVSRAEFDELVSRVDRLIQLTEQIVTAGEQGRQQDPGYGDGVLFSRVERLEEAIKQLEVNQAELYERIIARLEESPRSIRWVSSTNTDAEATSPNNKVVISAYGRSSLRIVLPNGGFLEVQGSESGSRGTVPSASDERLAERYLRTTQAVRKKYRVTHEPMPISRGGHWSQQYVVAGPPNGSQILVPLFGR
jgi:hypothetical protein